MYIGNDWGPCKKCGVVTPHKTVEMHLHGGIGSIFMCSKCNQDASKREVEELKQRILRLEARIAELTAPMDWPVKIHGD